jgi:4-diphosphocytidyl-2-C-methyl-D-erythritol kinase
LNVFLAVTGRRADGFHDLVSVVAPLDFGDTLRLEPAEAFSLRCTAPEVPGDDSNLVLKAARAFMRESGWGGAAAFALHKEIPLGAGLGGGSSDAVAALRGLNQLVNDTHRLSEDALARVAAELGSDCPLFLQDAPVVMRGRGDRITRLPDSAIARLRGRRVLVFKPAFGIATPWSYARLAAAAPQSYLPAEQAESRLAAWLEAETAPVEQLLFNNMEPPAFEKFLALPVLCRELARRFRLQPHLSGSGSACFAFLAEETEVRPIIAVIREAWGESAFTREARLT